MLQEVSKEGRQSPCHEQPLQLRQLRYLLEVNLKGVRGQRRDVELDELLDDVPDALALTWRGEQREGCGCMRVDWSWVSAVQFGDGTSAGR